MKLVYGVGIYNKGNYSSRREGLKSVPTKEYQLWLDMLRRCYSAKKQTLSASYIGCTVSDNFKNFQFFAEWCNNQVGFGNDGWGLDKDILVKGNKVYSEDTCVFVPITVNSILITPIKTRKLPLCVYEENEKFRVIVRVGGFKSSLGLYETPEKAFFRYKIFKESLIRETAEIWKDKIDHRVYNALLSYEVEITD